MKPNLFVKVAGVTLTNPVIAASGCYGFGDDYTDLYPPNVLGGVSCKGTTLEPRDGNPTPRIAETHGGILNSVGLQNYGVDKFAADFVPKLKAQGCVVIANIAGSTLEDYAEAVSRLDGTDVDLIELNISCPNVKQGGAAFGVTAEGAALVTKAVRAVTKKPIMVKLTPNVTDIVSIAKAVEAEGADALSLINTLLGMRIDINTRRPVLKNNVGGLSGAAVFPVALRMVWQVANAVDIDVVGLGGISSASDAIEMMLAGAKAVQVGTAIISDPFAPLKIIGGISEYMRVNKIKNLTEIIGKVKPW
ncbi:MAG: dihydroorotate dehydrogenase [Oscillospiraceae bacterium]|jgi:dihydroorotate dehydrogenase (NAD+) catalytic subunit|nr:dihydroorotate dehydrogenase [Oscillospiraceae bacterium]